MNVQRGTNVYEKGWTCYLVSDFDKWGLLSVCDEFLFRFSPCEDQTLSAWIT
jgi:hypothetical protein